ncbi:hypothetical protein V1638_08360 [Pseudarthrobacter sp. J64]|uniref:hypothetical protein n=1 Tax=Pseudarthrobacter sp. J64 TaxID=3116485 RepID=UPI002E820BAF|nr:hypothetical protein [Pseudarthrobacter sp. J64]MEE2569411.1 hypothetical protein [Pseudarthrobacter sp. J64]
MSNSAGAPGPGKPPPAPSVRAQLLATEHWGLLASRSTAQAEVLTRISMFLMFTSASLVSLALVGQATGFTGMFLMLAIIVIAIDALMGLLTQQRVMNVAMEDLMYVLAMNRLRAAYVELDPGVARYLMASAHDDEAGAGRTYDFFGSRTDFSQVSGSSAMFMTAANSTLLGILAGVVVTAAGAGTAVAVALGAVCGLAFLGLTLAGGYRRYRTVWAGHTPVSPSPEG